jgi:hypothetical protein
MDWVTNFLKHLGISRSVIGAAFITSAVLYAGPRVAPVYIEPIPKEWAPAVLAVLVFSASLLFFWACVGTWEIAHRRWRSTSALFASQELNQTEQEILLAMGERPSEPINLENINYETVCLSRLEVLELVHSLKKKGLVSINRYSDHLVSLTPTGRQRALEIQRAFSANST